MRQFTENGTAPKPPTPRTTQQEEARTRALLRVCAGFTTTISPHSAARLADLLNTRSQYEKAA